MLLFENSFIVHVLSRVMGGVADGFVVLCHCSCQIFFSCAILILTPFLVACILSVWTMYKYCVIADFDNNLYHVDSNYVWIS